MWQSQKSRSTRLSPSQCSSSQVSNKDSSHTLEFLHHHAVRQILDSGELDEERLSKLLPQIQSNQLVVCVLQLAAFILSEPQLHFFVKMLQKTVSVEECLEKALSSQRWSDVEILTRVFDVKREVLHRVLAKALECRQWDVIDTCLQRGGDIATACAVNGLDLDARTAGLHEKTVLRQAFEDRGLWTKFGEKLLQAGADPSAAGGSIILQAVTYQDWNRVRFVLQHCRAPPDIASRLLPDGGTLLHVLCEEDQADIVHMLFAMGADPLLTDRHGNTLMMAALGGAEATEVIDNRMMPGFVKSVLGERKETLLRVLVKSGAATHQAMVSQRRLTGEQLSSARASCDSQPQTGHLPLPLQQAVKTGQLRIAKILYASGACSYREIHHVATSPSIREAMENAKRRDILHFLNDISSGPRSLLQTCNLAVSHLIGCGPGRDVRAASLGLPDPLRCRVLQDHVTSPDFLKDYPPDPKFYWGGMRPLHVCKLRAPNFVFRRENFTYPSCSCEEEMEESEIGQNEQLS